MSKLNAWIIMLTFPVLLNAQALQLSGYYEPQILTLKQQGSLKTLYSNKFRLDFEHAFSSLVEFKANVNGFTYHGATTWNLLDFLPPKVTAPLHPSLRPFFVFQYQDSLSLDNIFIRLRFTNIEIIAGKQQFSLGSGYVWNPTDLFHNKAITDPTYEQPGVNGISANVQVSSRSLLMFFSTFPREWEHYEGFLRWQYTLGHFDLSLIAAQRYWVFSDWQGLYWGAPVNQQSQRRRLLGADFSGEWLSLGWHGEGAYNWLSAGKAFWEGVVGLDYTWENGFYLLLEIYHNNRLPRRYKDLTLSNWMQFILGESKSLTRDQVFVMLQYPFTDLLTVQTSLIYSSTDGSAAVIPTFLYSLEENVDLTAIGQFFWGKEGSAYADNLGNGFYLRARYYF